MENFESFANTVAILHIKGLMPEIRMIYEKLLAITCIILKEHAQLTLMLQILFPDNHRFTLRTTVVFP